MKTSTRWYNAGRFERACYIEDAGGKPGGHPLAPDATVGLYLYMTALGSAWPFGYKFYWNNGAP